MSKYYPLPTLNLAHDDNGPPTSTNSYDAAGNIAEDPPEKFTDSSMISSSLFKDKNLIWLLAHGLIAGCWGAALLVFVVVHVPIDWTISQALQNRPDITNTFVTLVATLSTTHIKYTLQDTVEMYSRRRMVQGFKIGDLKWMQGVKQVAFFTKFGGRKRGYIFWLVIYAGFAAHSSSLVAILQPHIFIKNTIYDDPVPCGINATSLSLDANPLLTDAEQQYMDTLSTMIGTQFPNYGEQIKGNSTTSVGGRVYVKDTYAFGAVGGLINGLQEVSGVFFFAQCNDTPADALSVWQSTFPNLSLPNFATLPDGSRNFTDNPAPPGLANVMSQVTPFNLSSTNPAFYALVAPTGDGALFSTVLQPDNGVELPLICSWKAIPQLVQIQMINYTVTTVSSSGASVYPAPVGRATLMAMQGMALMSRSLGLTLQSDIVNAGIPIPMIVATLIADAGKASMTLYSENVSLNVRSGNTPPESLPLCNSKNRTVQPHWEFGNTNNLGWIAIVWSLCTGLFAVGMVFFVSGKRRSQVGILEPSEAFAFGRNELVGKDKILRVRHGRVIVGDKL